MTANDLKALMRKYDDAIREGLPRLMVKDRADKLDRADPNRATYFLEHARWMCERIPGHEDIEKRNRWLGFVQCILVYERIFKLNELKEHVRNM